MTGRAGSGVKGREMEGKDWKELDRAVRDKGRDEDAGKGQKGHGRERRGMEGTERDRKVWGKRLVHCFNKFNVMALV